MFEFILWDLTRETGDAADRAWLSSATSSQSSDKAAPTQQPQLAITNHDRIRPRTLRPVPPLPLERLRPNQSLRPRPLQRHPLPLPLLLAIRLRTALLLQPLFGQCRQRQSGGGERGRDRVDCGLFESSVRYWRVDCEC